MSIIDIKAAQKWSKIPKKFQEKIIHNVFCSNCGATTIVDYTMENDRFGILLKGKCNTCGGNVARLVENE